MLGVSDGLLAVPASHVTGDEVGAVENAHPVFSGRQRHRLSDKLPRDGVVIGVEHHVRLLFGDCDSPVGVVEAVDGQRQELWSLRLERLSN